MRRHAQGSHGRRTATSVCAGTSTSNLRYSARNSRLALSLRNKTGERIYSATAAAVSPAHDPTPLPTSVHFVPSVSAVYIHPVEMG